MTDTLEKEEVRYMDLLFITTGCARHGMGNQVFAGVIRQLPETESSIKTMGCYEDGGSYSIPKEALAEIGIDVDTVVDQHDSHDVPDLVHLLHSRARGSSQIFEIKWNEISASWEATELAMGEELPHATD